MQRGLKRFFMEPSTEGGTTWTDIFGPVTGKILQIGYFQGDTGIRLDTGAELSLSFADTGKLNGTYKVFDTHLDSSFVRAPAQPVVDTGGDPAFYAAGGLPVLMPLVFAGEVLRATINGIATDTGKTGKITIWTE